MNNVYACTVNELQRIYGRKKSIVLAGLGVAIPIILALFISFMEKGLGIIPVGSAGYPLWILSMFTTLLIPLFVAMTAADIFSGEYGDGSIKIALLKPVTRFKIYCSKIGALGLYIIANLILIFLSASLSAIFLSGSGLLSGMAKGLVAYSAAVLPMLLVAIGSAFIAQFFKSSSGALVTCILAYIALKVLSAFYGDFSGLMITSSFNWHLLWTAAHIQPVKIFSVFMFIFSYSIIFMAAGFYFFDRKEF